MTTLTCTGGSDSHPGFWEKKTNCSLHRPWTSEIARAAQAFFSSSVQMKSEAVHPPAAQVFIRPGQPPIAVSHSESRMLPVLNLKQTRTVMVIAPVDGS